MELQDTLKQAREFSKSVSTIRRIDAVAPERLRQVLLELMSALERVTRERDELQGRIKGLEK